MRFTRSLGRYLLEGAVGGRCEFRTQPTNARHSHSYYEVCLATGGAGAYHHGGRDLDLARGDLFLAEPGVVHEISSWRTRDLELFFLSFTLRGARAGHAPEDGEERIAAAFDAGREIHRPGCGHLGGYVPFVARAEGALPRAAASLLALEAMALLAGGAEPGRGAADLDDALDGAATVAEAAERLGISARTLQRRARGAFGHGAREEMERRAMNRAAHRLLMGYGVGETAAWLGEDPDAFARRFRRVQGLSPKRYQTRFAPGAGAGGGAATRATDHTVASARAREPFGTGETSKAAR